MAAQRLNRMKVEFSTLLTSPPPGVTCRVDDANAEILIATITGPEGSPFEDGQFEVEISLSDRYPFTPPIAKFLTSIYHPNIDSEGRICLSGLKSKPSGSWNCSMNIATILSAIRILLGEPNLSDPLMTNIAEEYRNNYAAYLEKAKDSARKCSQQKKSDSNHPATELTKLPPPTPKLEPDINDTMEEDLFPFEDSDGDNDVCLSPILKSQINRGPNQVPSAAVVAGEKFKGPDTNPTTLRPSEGKNSSTSKITRESEQTATSTSTTAKSSDRSKLVLVASNSSTKMTKPASAPVNSIPIPTPTKFPSYTGSQSSSQTKPLTLDDFLFDSEEDDDDFSSVPKNPTKKLKFTGINLHRQLSNSDPTEPLEAMSIHLQHAPSPYECYTDTHQVARLHAAWNTCEKYRQVLQH